MRLAGRPGEAERFARRALALGADPARAAFEIGVAQYARGRLDEAEDTFRSLLADRALPEAARREALRFLADARGRDGLSWSVSLQSGWERNISGAGEGTERLRSGFVVRNPPPRETPYLWITPALSARWAAAPGLQLWARPSAPVRRTSGGDHDVLALELALGASARGPLGLTALPSHERRVEVRRAPDGDSDRITRSEWRLAARRAFPGAALEPWIAYRSSGREGVSPREREQEWGASLSLFPSRLLEARLQGSLTRLRNVPGIRRFEPFNRAHRRRASLSLGFRAGNWLLEPRLEVENTRYNDNQLRLVSPNEPDRADDAVRLSLGVSNESWSARGYTPVLTLRAAWEESNDPRGDLGRGTGVSLGLRRLF